MGVQVAQQRDLRAVVDDLAGDVQHERGHRVLREGALGGPAGCREPVLAEAPDAVGPLPSGGRSI